MGTKFNEDHLRSAGYSPDGKGGWHKKETSAFSIPSTRREVPVPAAPAPGKTAKESMQALGRLPQGVMNKTEKAYSEHLEADPDVVWWKFEPFRLILAPKTSYSPDFLVMRRNSALEVHEVKGMWTDDARVKIKVAAAAFPVFPFIAVRRIPRNKGGGWQIEQILS